MLTLISIKLSICKMATIVTLKCLNMLVISVIENVYLNTNIRNINGLFANILT